MTRLNQRSKPVTLPTKRTTATKIPAAAIDPGEKDCAIATAAIAFIGWTGSRMPKKMPVKMLKRPEKIRVLAREMVWFAARASAMGRNVPKSPREPAISET